jgi:hypothetical protein
MRFLKVIWYYVNPRYRRRARRAAAFSILFNAGLHLMLSKNCDWDDLAAARLIKEKMIDFAA